MHSMRKVYGNNKQSWIRRHSIVLTVTLAMVTGFVYLWDVGCTCTVLALSLVYLGGATYYMFNTRQKVNAKRLIVITGCDSGLGYSLALHCRTLGATVVAGILKYDGKALDNLRNNGVIVRYLDITNQESVERFREEIKTILREQKLVLHALVNNAAVMIFGEFEWQTADQIQRQVAVNLLGTMRITQELMPIIRTYASRIIVISSHCALESLPGLSVYGATKAALSAWCNSLRVELTKYGIKVVAFIPGSFVKESNIMVQQKEHFEIMNRSMSQEAKDFYGDYFTRYAQYFSSVASGNDPNEPMCVTNPGVYESFNGALLDICPSAVYKYEPWKYFFYHTLFKITPTWMRDRLVHRLVCAPLWKVK